ncbi:ABC transporter substrate-binding protein [Paenibacillus daejeonensis]|uniref:ABC transporter substrate-binding protein n=1 Tax=Paenibacillus daejeonensis TaxID=135193 RepID=UPI0003684D74|nr:ABC transporter substrate-binding protein [Paenibacillus daejeonensis]
MKTLTKSKPVLLMLVCMMLFAAACGANNEPQPNPPSAGATEENTGGETAPPEQPVEKVTVKFSEVIRSIFYAPHYVAIGQGFFEEEGLEIDMNTAQGSDKGAAALIAGTADISLVGPETAIYIYNQEGDNKIKIFHQLTMKDGSFLLAREPVQDFDWSELEGKTVIGWRPGSAPQMVMNSQLLREGVNGVDVVTNLAAPAMAGAFASGQGDYIQLFEPVASTLELDGSAHYVASMGEMYGDFPETSYVATGEYLERHPEVVERFVRAVTKGTSWLMTASDDEIAEVLMPFFEGTPKEVVIQSVNRYKAQDTWSEKPELTQEMFDILQNVLVENGVLKEEERIAEMSDVVDMSFVNQLP